MIAEGAFLAYVVLLPLVQVPPFPVVTRVLLVASAIATLVLAWQRRSRPPFGPIAGWLSAFVVLSALSVLTSFDVLRSGQAASKFLLRQLVVFWIASTLLMDLARRRRFVRALVLSGIVLVGACAWLYAGGGPSVFGGLQGPGLDYNSVCMLLVPMVPFAFASLEAGTGRSGRAFGLVSAVILVGAAIGTYSRIGWGALLVAITVSALLGGNGRRVIAASAVALALFVVVAPDLSAIGTITDNDRFLVKETLELESTDLKKATWRDVVTFNHRLEYAWRPALAIALRHPLLGAGYGPATFEALAPRDAGPVLMHEHSAFLAVAVQSGFPALVAYVGLLTAVLARLARLHPGTAFDAALVVALVAAVLSEYVFQAIGEPTNNTRMGILFAALAGLASAVPEARAHG